ncbi:hypothetical protein GCM10023075_37930 [Streptosporangium album]
MPASSNIFVSQAEPTKSFADATWMSVCSSTCNGKTNGERRALTGFTLSGIPKDVEDVKLTLEVMPTRTTDTVITVHKVTDTWSKDTTTWNSKPALGETVTTHTGFTANKAAQFDVSSAFTGNGSYSFALTSGDGPVSVLYSSRETGDRGPRLKISYTPASTTTPPPASGNCLPFDKPSPAALRSFDKKVFAFYFPPYPLSIDNKDPAKDQYASWLDPLGSNGMYAAQGGHSRDRPLPRPVRSDKNWRQLDFEVEVRQAIAMGLDGFIYEHHTSATDQRFNQFPLMLAAAKAVDPGFRIMLSPDFPTAKDASPDKVISDVLMAKGHPSLYTLDDGTIPLAPFYPERQSPSWWDNVRGKLAAKGMKTSLMPIFLDWNSSGKTEWNDHVTGYSSWGNRWVSSADTLRKASVEAHKRGRLYMAPIAFEDVRPRDKRFWEPSNSQNLQQSFLKAAEGDADIISLITWNDYAESWLAPSVERGYAPADLIAYYTTLFKTGKTPVVARDALYYFHRSHRTDAPFDATKQTIGAIKIPYGDTAKNTVELVAFLKTPGKLVIRQGDQVSTSDAQAGLVSFKAEMVPGTTPVFELQRGGKTVQTLTSKTPIRKSVVYQDLINHAGGGLTCKRP